MDTSELQRLPIEEKLRLVFQLWDEIAASNELIQLSPAVVRDLDRRTEELIHNPHLAIDEDEMWRRVDGNAS